jgi:ClpP class serine protease
MLDKMGLSVTFIFAGKHKVDGNSYEALPDDVKARIQERIDELYAVFVTSVAENRGLEEQAVRDTEALCFTASQAVSNGFADSVGALDDALADFSASLDDQSDNTGEEAMADEANGSAVDQAALNAAREEGQTAGHAAGVTEGGTAMQTRIAAILGSDEAKGREGLANHFAFKTAMSAEDAIAALAESPKAEADEGGNTPFDNAMSKDNPDVGAGEGGNDDEASSSPIALARAAGIRGVRPAAAPAK